MSKKETPPSALEKLTQRTHAYAAAEMHTRRERKGHTKRFNDALTFIKEHGEATTFEYRGQTITDYRTESIDTSKGVVYLTHQDNNFSGKTIKAVGIFEIDGTTAEQDLLSLTMFPGNLTDHSVHIRSQGKRVKDHKKRQHINDAFKEIMAAYKTKHIPPEKISENVIFETKKHKEKKDSKKKK